MTIKDEPDDKKKRSASSPAEKQAGKRSKLEDLKVKTSEGKEDGVNVITIESSDEEGERLLDEIGGEGSAVISVLGESEDHEVTHVEDTRVEESQTEAV